MTYTFKELKPFAQKWYEYAMNELKTKPVYEFPMHAHGYASVELFKTKNDDLVDIFNIFLPENSIGEFACLNKDGNNLIIFNAKI